MTRLAGLKMQALQQHASQGYNKVSVDMKLDVDRHHTLKVRLRYCFLPSTDLELTTTTLTPTPPCQVKGGGCIWRKSADWSSLLTLLILHHACRVSNPGPPTPQRDALILPSVGW